MGFHSSANVGKKENNTENKLIGEIAFVFNKGTL